MENNDTNTNILDDLNSPSISKKEPTFSITNIFKPTAKNKIIIGMMVKIISIGLVALGGSLLAMVALSTDFSKDLLKYGIVFNIIGLIGGAIGECIILFTKEEPLSSLIRAAEDIKLDAIKEVAIESTTQPPVEPVSQ